MTLSDKQKIFTRNLASFIIFAFEHGFELTFGEVARMIEMQKIYFDSGRSKTMNSRHLDKLAADFAIWYKGVMLFAPGISKEQYRADLQTMRPLCDYWESLHPDNVCGADWNRNGIFDETFLDPYHFEIKP